MLLLMPSNHMRSTRLSTQSFCHLRTTAAWSNRKHWRNTCGLFWEVRLGIGMVLFVVMYLVVFRLMSFMCDQTLAFSAVILVIMPYLQKLSSACKGWQFCYHCCYQCRSRDSSVTSLGAGHLSNSLLIPGRSRRFSPVQHIQATFGVHPAFYSVGTGNSFTEDKVAVAWSWPLHSVPIFDWNWLSNPSIGNLPKINVCLYSSFIIKFLTVVFPLLFVKSVCVYIHLTILIFLFKQFYW